MKLQKLLSHGIEYRIWGEDPSVADMLEDHSAIIFSWVKALEKSSQEPDSEYLKAIPPSIEKALCTIFSPTGLCLKYSNKKILGRPSIEIYCDNFNPKSWNNYDSEYLHDWQIQKYLREKKNSIYNA